jgi:hypothetical protein
MKRDYGPVHIPHYGPMPHVDRNRQPTVFQRQLRFAAQQIRHPAFTVPVRISARPWYDMTRWMLLAWRSAPEEQPARRTKTQLELMPPGRRS